MSPEGIDDKVVKKARKNGRPQGLDSQDLLSEIFTEENLGAENLPSKIAEVPHEVAFFIKDIRQQMKTLVDKQNKEVSSEFTALMDGYVSKANESESFKVKFEHLEETTEDLKADLKELKDANKRLSSDLEAAREALRLSEADLQNTKKDSEQFRLESNEQIYNLTEEKKLLKEKIRKMQESKDTMQSELENKIDELITEQEELRKNLLESDHRFKSLEQESTLDVENSKRSQRDSEKLIKELKDQLELRNREVEYKDALLNQIVKQASSEKQMLSQQMFEKQKQVNQAKAAPKPPSSSIEETEDEKLSASSIWGAFRK